MKTKVYGNCLTFVSIANDNDIFWRIDDVNYTFERFTKGMQVSTFVLNKETAARLVIVSTDPSVVVKLCLCTNSSKHIGMIYN